MQNIERRLESPLCLGLALCNDLDIVGAISYVIQPINGGLCCKVRYHHLCTQHSYTILENYNIVELKIIAAFESDKALYGSYNLLLQECIQKSIISSPSL